MVKDYYKVLDVPRDAEMDVIKQAFRELAKQYHPDKTAALGVELRELASQKMMEINEAFQTLTNPEARREYDEELKKAEQEAAPGRPQPPAQAPPAAATPRPSSGAKSDFWRDIERIEAERKAADEAAAVREAKKAAEPEKPKEKAASAASASLKRNVILDYADKFYRGIMQSGPRWSVDKPRGWEWVLETGDWRKSYVVGYCHVDNLGSMGLKRVMSRIEALLEGQKGILKQSHFFFLVSYDRLMDSAQVIESCRSWALEGRREGQRLFALLDATSLATQLFGVPHDDRMRSVVQFLGPRK